jgi:uncharacterized protein (DUF58 family)
MKLVPTNKLLFWVGIIFLPFSILAVTMPATAVAGIGMSAALLLFATVDAFASRNRLRGIRITLPEIVRLSVGRESEMALHIENDPIHVKRLRLGLAFPREIYSERQDFNIELPETEPNSFISWPFRAMKQGQYFLEKCYLETPSLLGFWAVRRSTPTQAEIRVYPDLFRERKRLTALFLNRGIGIHPQRQVGKGREFEQLREYLPGDSLEDIHWKATAKRGEPVTKVFQLERTQQVYMIIDGSRLSARNSDASTPVSSAQQQDNNYTTIMERFAAAALVMGLAADRQGDLFGLLAFDDKIRKFVRAKNGRAHYDVCRDALYTIQARSVSPDFNELFTFIGTQIRRRALLIILTNLDDPVLAESFATHIDVVSRRHLVLVNMIKPIDVEPLFSDAHVKSVNDLYGKLGGHMRWRHLRETEKLLQRRGIGFHMLANENLCADLVSQYLTVKRRQLI